MRQWLVPLRSMTLQLATHLLTLTRMVSLRSNATRLVLALGQPEPQERVVPEPTTTPARARAQPQVRWHWGSVSESADGRRHDSNSNRLTGVASTDRPFAR
jgi:hypothetical protein